MRVVGYCLQRLCVGRVVRSVGAGAVESLGFETGSCVAALQPMLGPGLEPGRPVLGHVGYVSELELE